MRVLKMRQSEIESADLPAAVSRRDWSLCRRYQVHISQPSSLWSTFAGCATLHGWWNSDSTSGRGLMLM